jgi:hypothetical protein
VGAGILDDGLARPLGVHGLNRKDKQKTERKSSAQ